jgi:Domain of unknown function (DUF4389)
MMVAMDAWKDLPGDPQPDETGAAVYPARLDGTLDENLSRWMWLVKWFLAIPHFIVLFFLAIAFFFATVIAFFAILFTGRYPRSIFDFNVGVLRWGWRVGFYSYSALGTDRYPPFSLADDPDYPARFSVDYPERLSRGRVLFKWWLLAIPHYAIVGLFVGGAVSSAGQVNETGGASDWHTTTSEGGLIGIVVVIGALWLLFGGRYPQGLFRFAMGLNRWTFRVIAYAALMRDEYPPFSLDQGGRDPGTPAAAAEAASPTEPDPPEAPAW